MLDEVNQEESEQNEVDRVKQEAGMMHIEKLSR